MKGLLRKPAVNAVCISLFTAFYSLIFFATAGNVEFTRVLYYTKAARLPENDLFWGKWSRFLADGNHIYFALILIALTAAVVLMLLTRRRPYDEYHVDRLLTCLVAAMFFTIMAIAAFYLLTLSETAGIVEKFTLFVVIHWTTVVLADLAYVFACRWK